MSLRAKAHRGEMGLIQSGTVKVYTTLRRSFLLSFATFGLILIVLGGTVFSRLDLPTVAGLSGAAGIIIFLSNLLGYGIYKYLEQNY